MKDPEALIWGLKIKVKRTGFAASVAHAQSLLHPLH